jgi:hypothetical protein
MGMHVYDMKTGQDRDVLKGTVEGLIRIPSGSPYAYGMKNNIARQLDLATLREIQEMPDVKDLEALDADPSGDLLLEGWNLISPATGRVLARIEADLGFLSPESKVARTFFGRGGERDLALTANGLVVTLEASE